MVGVDGVSSVNVDVCVAEGGKRSGVWASDSYIGANEKKFPNARFRYEYLPWGKSIAVDLLEHTTLDEQRHENLNTVVHVFGTT
jgi:hypothetical protein